MASLQDFNSYPGQGETSILEKDGRLTSMPMAALDVAACEHPVICTYPNINISRELCHFGARDINVQSCSDGGRSPGPRSTQDCHRYNFRSSPTNANCLIQLSNEPLFKRCSRVFFEDGFISALQEAAADESDDSRNRTHFNSFLRKFATQALRFVDLLAHAQLYVQVQQRAQHVQTNTIRFSQTRDWQRSIIRTIAWHPQCMRFSVAACDDSVRIYSDIAQVMNGTGKQSSGGCAAVLKNHLQKQIGSMAWRPFTAGELAIACQNGVLLWSWDPNSNITRTMCQPQHLKCDEHIPVTSLAWNHSGRLLATASCSDTNVYLWDVDQNQRMALRRIGAPCALLIWSPNHRSLFTSTVGSVFRVWSAHNWTPERWTVPAGAVQSASWSPCGGYLLFVTTEEQYLYCLSFMEEQLFANTSTPKAAYPVIDLSKRTISGRQTEVGGLPQSIVWDSTGKRLAVNFKESGAIAVFLTSITPTRLNIVADCVLVGLSAELPHHISFQPQYNHSSDTVLAIGWSTGRIQFFPFL